MSSLLRALFVFLFLFAEERTIAQISYIWMDDKPVEVRFENLDESISDLSLLRQGRSRAILGSWREDGKAIFFRPALHFTGGVTYVVHSGGTKILEFSVTSPDTAPATRIVDVYPGMTLVPENLLKIHIVFSGPMSEQPSENLIVVTTERGDTLPNIFLPLQPELWNREKDQLTLWLDPGRIKRGLNPNLDSGLPLTNGVSYTISISGDWKDEKGRPIQSSYAKEYTAKDADRVRPELADFKLIAPVSKSLNPVYIHLESPLDYSLFGDCCVVLQGGKIVQGFYQIDQDETQWSFVPTNPWTPGAYRIRINSRLEDLAGNNLNHLFDREIGGTDDVKEDTYHYLDFQIN